MGAVDSVPVASQLKSGVQAIAGDTKGARETQENFLDTCPVVSQGKSFVYWWVGDNEAARKTQLKFLKGVGDFLDGVPVVGHAKGGIHYAFGDKDGGDNAMKSASRTVGVIIGGAAGGLGGGPVGAFAGGIAGGAALDGITTGVDSAVHNEYRPAGQVAAVTKIVNRKASVGDVFDSAAGLVFDGFSGHGFGKTAMEFRVTGRKFQLYRVAGQEEVNKAKQAFEHVDSWTKYKNSFTREVVQYGKGANGPSFKPKLNSSAKKEKEEETANIRYNLNCN